MSKIICDICGTSYPDTADCCPICGCSRDSAIDLLGADLLADDSAEKSRAAAKRRKEIFDFDEVNDQRRAEALDNVEVEDSAYEDEEESSGGSGTNVPVVIFLTILIVGLLLLGGFLFVRFIQPTLGHSGVETTAATTEESTQTELPDDFIPCQSLALTSGAAVLNEQGQLFLLHVSPIPEDTTEKIYFESANENVATVGEDGKITAIGEGETVIYITCGNMQLTCSVTCNFVEETTAVTEATEAETVASAQAEAATEVDAEADEDAEDTEATAAATVDPNVILKLKKTDIMLGVYYKYQLELDCGLKPEDVQWKSEHPYIASVDETGCVTAIKSGTTSITAKYGDQEVQCLVRCS